ncbi:thiol-disulfide oxidoreductase DCC family protein [soil metagenome]
MDQPVILFDGVCNFCNGAVQFIIKRDKKHRYKFAPLQSGTGEQIQKQFNLPTDLSSFILYENDSIYKKSTAALMVAKHLSGLWPLLYLFIVLPTFIRDIPYNIIVKYRYKWFGKTEECMIPSPELRARFLN